MVTYWGIDAGAKGALAIYQEAPLLDRGYTITCVRFSQYEPRGLATFLNSLPTPDAVILEALCARPGQSAQSTFSLGKSYGWITGVLDSINAPVVEQRPQQWQKGLLISPKLSYTERKAALTTLVRRRYPWLILSSDKAKAIEEADAILLVMSIVEREGFL